VLRAAAVVGGLAFINGGWASPARADTGCHFDELGRWVCGGGDGDPGSGGPQGVTGRAFRWGSIAVFDFYGPSGAIFPVWCNPATGESAPGPDIGFPHPAFTGRVHRVWAITSEGAVALDVDRCIAPGQPATPPDPPTWVEIWEAVPVPDPAVNVSPAGNGVTGLETWLWGAPAGGLTVGPLGIGGYSITGTAVASRWEWQVGPAGYGAESPGSQRFPGARHMFETRGDYTIDHIVRWGGTFTVSGFGVSVTGDPGPHTEEASRAYHVIEIRAVLVDGD
jgi:hypothetical protein